MEQKQPGKTNSHGITKQIHGLFEQIRGKPLPVAGRRNAGIFPEFTGEGQRIRISNPVGDLLNGQILLPQQFLRRLHFELSEISARSFAGVTPEHPVKRHDTDVQSSSNLPD